MISRGGLELAELFKRRMRRKPEDECCLEGILNFILLFANVGYSERARRRYRRITLFLCSGRILVILNSFLVSMENDLDLNAWTIESVVESLAKFCGILIEISYNFVKYLTSCKGVLNNTT